MSYLQFEPVGRSESGKTLIVAVRARGSHDALGVIDWYAQWRKYTFTPRENCVFDASCLREIADHTEAMTAAHKAPVVSGNAVGSPEQEGP